MGFNAKKHFPWMSEFHSVCLSHLDFHLSIFFLTEAVVLNQPRIACFAHMWKKWTILPRTLLVRHPPPPPTQTATDPAVKPCFLNFRDSRAPSALRHTESNASRAAGISRLLSQMRQLVFHRSFVFLILLRFRLSCRTLRCVPALKCD